MPNRIVLALAALSALAHAGCATPAIAPSETRAGAVPIEAAGLRAEWAPDIDRCVWFGAADGPNMLFVPREHRDALPREDGYTFFGGCYTWVAPQNGPLGWRNADGEEQPWPPDPAMDVGPARVSARSHYAITTTGPRHRSGLVERKTLRLDYDLCAEFDYELINDSAASRIAAPWTTTAARPDAILAIRAPEGTTFRGWDDASVQRLHSIMSPPNEHGWVTIDLSRAAWDGGVKVYATSPGATVRPEIAVWRRSYWFLRRADALSGTDIDRLTEVGEGPVAVYIEPRAGIVEAELYGAPRNLAPGESTRTREEWLIIRAKARGDLSALPQ